MSSRTNPAPHRATFRSVPISEIDWRLVAPASRRVLDRVARVGGFVGSPPAVSIRALVLASTASSVGTAAFALGILALFR